MSDDSSPDVAGHRIHGLIQQAGLRLHAVGAPLDVLLTGLLVGRLAPQVLPDAEHRGARRSLALVVGLTCVRALTAISVNTVRATCACCTKADLSRFPAACCLHAPDGIHACDALLSSHCNTELWHHSMSESTRTRLLFERGHGGTLRPNPDETTWPLAAS